jgi:molybdopterin converting factor small subunit
MQAQVIGFGQIKEITGPSPVVLEDVHDTEEVIARMHQLYPQLSGLVYVLAIDKHIVRGKTPLKDNATIAFLPPYSGG